MLSFKRFAAARTATAAIEFAVWCPFLALLFFGGVDLTRFATATSRLETVASTIGQMLSVSTGSVTDTDLQFYHDSAMIIFPQVLSDAAQQAIPWSSDISITISSVSFTTSPPSCTQGCAYTPKLLWSYGTNKRSCTVTAVPAPDSSPPSPTTLPQDVFGPGSLLVVDVGFVFKPILASRLLPSMPIYRSFYIAPRYVDEVTYSPGSTTQGQTTVCPQ